MLAGGVLAGVGRGLHQSDLYLERSVRQTAKYLRFCRHLCGHEVEYPYLQRTDILVERPVLRHDEYMLVFKY